MYIKKIMNTKNLKLIIIEKKFRFFLLTHEQHGEDGIRTHKVHLGVLIFIIC